MNAWQGANFENPQLNIPLKDNPMVFSATVSSQFALMSPIAHNNEAPCYQSGSQSHKHETALHKLFPNSTLYAVIL
jgi:hypothetical protein